MISLKLRTAIFVTSLLSCLSFFSFSQYILSGAAVKKVHYFRVYNRWGQQLFSTNSLIEGWDGTINGVKQQTGTYVCILKAEDLAGKIYEMKGVSTLIR